MSEEKIEAGDVPLNIVAQYVRDMSFENPNASEFLRGGQEPPEMDINIGMDARKLEDTNKDGTLFEVVINLRAEAKGKKDPVFIAELQFGAVVNVSPEVPEDNHHPLLLIEVPRLLFPFARHIISTMTVHGGYPPLLLNPVDFYALYMERFGEEIENARAEINKQVKESTDNS